VTLTFESDPDTIKMKQRATHLGQRSLRSNVVVRTHGHTHTHTHTHPTEYFTWTIKYEIRSFKRKLVNVIVSRLVHIKSHASEDKTQRKQRQFDKGTGKNRQLDLTYGVLHAM